MLRFSSSFIVLPFLCFAFLFLSSTLRSQNIEYGLTKKFLAANELFLLEGDLTSMEWQMSDGKKKTMYDLASQYWPDKIIVTISVQEYDANEDVNDMFHLSFSTLNSTVDGEFSSSIDFLNIQKGKTGRAPGRVVYYVYADFADLVEVGIGERVENAVKSMQHILENFDDRSKRSGKFYKSEKAQSIIESKTLYLKRSELKEDLLSKEKLEKAYPFKVELVEDDEWKEIVRSGKRAALYLELVHGFKYSAVDLYDAETGILLLSSYPWFKLHATYKVDKKFLSKLK